VGEAGIVTGHEQDPTGHQVTDQEADQFDEAEADRTDGREVVIDPETDAIRLKTVVSNKISDRTPESDIETVGPYQR